MFGLWCLHWKLWYVRIWASKVWAFCSRITLDTSWWQLGSEYHEYVGSLFRQHLQIWNASTTTLNWSWQLNFRIRSLKASEISRNLSLWLLFIGILTLNLNPLLCLDKQNDKNLLTLVPHFPTLLAGPTLCLHYSAKL